MTKPRQAECELSMRTMEQIIASLSRSADDGQALPERLCSDCTAVLALMGTAMSLVTDAGFSAVVGASDPSARQLDESQFELGEGPAVEVTRGDVSACYTDLDDGDSARWPTFVPRAADAGVEWILALPLRVGPQRVGSLGLYGARRVGLGRVDVRAARAYADAAVVVLLQLQHRSLAAEGEPLHPALDGPVIYRAEVHQATGFVSVRASVGIDEALLLLRARAYASGRPLLEVSRDVLAGRLQLELDGDG